MEPVLSPFPASKIVSLAILVPLSNDGRYERSVIWLAKARFKRRTLHVPNPMQISENNRFFSFALDSAHVKFDV